MQVESPGKAALRVGLIMGGIMAVIYAVFSLAGQFIPAISLIALILSFIAWLVVYFVAGILGAKRTGRVGMGSLAGLWTAVFAGILATITNGILVAIDADRIRETTQAFADQMDLGFTYTNEIILASQVFLGICLTLFGIGLGAGLGALGGLIGRGNQPPVYPYPMYPPYGQPPFPPTPGQGQPPFPPPPGQEGQPPSAPPPSGPPSQA